MDELWNNYSYEVQVVGNYAYVAASESGLEIVNVSNPNNLAFAGSCATPGSAVDVAVLGNFAYLAAQGGGLRIINITNPTNPVQVGNFVSGGSVNGVAVQGDYCYITDGSLHILDISNPAVPIELGSLAIPASSIQVGGDYAFVCGGGNGIYIVKISNPYSPILMGYYNTPGEARKVAIDGDLAYLADYYNFGIYDCARAMMPPVELTIVPVNPPVQIPATGGSFQFNIEFENTSEYHINFDAWIEAMLPNAHNVIAFSRLNNSLSAGGIRSYTLTQSVPASAPAGQYIFNAYVGAYPDSAFNSDYFTFEKLPGR
jgi:hypothetical protein